MYNAVEAEDSHKIGVILKVYICLWLVNFILEILDDSKTELGKGGTGTAASLTQKPTGWKRWLNMAADVLVFLFFVYLTNDYREALMMRDQGKVPQDMY